MSKGEQPICPACGGEIANLASKCTVTGVPGHFHAGCAVQGRMIRNLYRAGLIAGLRQGLELVESCLTRASAASNIRARITALEEEGEKR